MEHRYSRRIPVQAQTGVYVGTFGWLTGRIVDMSIGGALVAIGATPVPSNAPITIAVRLDRSGFQEWMHLRAMVVRTEERHIGIEYLEDEGRTAGALRRLIEENGSSPFLVSTGEPAAAAPFLLPPPLSRETAEQATAAA